jgi:hypothetical protein
LSTLNKEQKNDLDRILAFGDPSKPITSTNTNKEPAVSYSTTLSRKVVQAGLVTETRIQGNTKTTTTRKQTDKEIVQNLHKVLNDF